MPTLEEIRSELHSLRNPKKAEQSKNYLKSPYNFYGITVPQLRKIAKKHKNLTIYETFNLFDELWNSGNHEEMCIALFLLTNHKKQFSLEFWNFLTKPERLNKFKTWDHVDEASSHTLGVILAENAQLNSQIKEFSQSKNTWVRRISIVSQYQSIKKGKIQLTILLAEKLCNDEDIYVQKGTGWMLREAAKKNPVQIKEFIKIHKDMKPWCLSYATEKMPEFKKLIKEQLKQEEIEKELKQQQKLVEQELRQQQNNKPVANISAEELGKIKYFKN